VKKGTVLAVLDDREAKINEEKARLNYQQLQQEFERQKELFEREMVSKDEFDRVKFNLETARLDWEQKKLLLSYTRITSPIDGVVTKRHIKLGNKINTAQLSFSVVQTKEKIAVVNIPEQEIDSIYLKQKAVVSTARRDVDGYIKRRSPAIDPESGTFKVTVAVEDEENMLAVGQFVNVKIIKKVHTNVILLSKEAVI
jgi:membrane fusion protein (multidrug efflux system)